jgi:uncharacterized protein (TIGR00369 family)
VPKRFMHCLPMSLTATPPDLKPDPGGEGPNAGASLHWRALERLYSSAPINRLFNSGLTITAEGAAQIAFKIDENCFHAAGAAHGTIYFKMLDDAAFYAANTLVTDRFLLTTAFNLHFTKPVRVGPVIAEGRWISGRKRVLVAESRLIDADGDEIGRGTGTFMRSRIALSGLAGYAAGMAGLDEPLT